MDSSQDTEITLGTAKMLGLFFGLVTVCAVFFALGYTLGRKSEAGVSPLSSAPLQSASNSAKPAGSASPAAPPMTFYKAVEQKDANAQLTPATDTASTPAANDQPSSPSGTQPTSAQTANPPDPMAPIPAGGYFVQVAAVTKQEDAEALVDALKKKQYPAFTNNASSDKLFRVQLGPFGDIKDAEGMRTRLVNDGYNPILKK
jgi:DedD protein